MFRNLLYHSCKRTHHYYNKLGRTYNSTSFISNSGAFGLIAMPIVACSLYSSPAQCSALESEVTVPMPVVEQVVLVEQRHDEKSSLLISMIAAAKRGTYNLFRAAYKTAAYFQRFLTYAIYGAPMVGLLPANYLLAEMFPEIEDWTWSYMIWALGQLGPCFVKLAQWASTRPDLFPPRLVSRLIQLQDDVPTYYPIEMTYNTLKTAFGDNWRDKLELDTKPLGAGSVAQVYKAKLRRDDGSTQDVAVKLIHPHVKKLVQVDMEILTLFANFIDLFPSLEILSVGETMRQFGSVMERQLDLTVEATNLEYFGKKFKEDSWAIFPQPIKGFSTKNVLVEELMMGTPIAKYMELPAVKGDANYELKMKLSDLGARLVLKMVFFDNFMHGDLHPGNVLVRMRDNNEPQLVVLDCGIVYFCRSEKEYKNLVEICLAFMKHDGREAARHMIANNPANTVKHSEAFMEGIQGLVDMSEKQSYFEHIGDYVSRVCELARVHCVRLDPSYFKVAMALKVAEGISLALNRELDLVSKCIPIVLKTQTMRKMGISKFPSPEDDDNRLINVQPHMTPDHPHYQGSPDKK